MSSPVQIISTEQILPSIPEGLTLITPNLLSTSQHTVIAGASEELFKSLEEIVKGSKLIEEDNNKKVIDSPFFMVEKEVSEEDLEVTIKIFFLGSSQNPEPSYIRQALRATLAKLGVSRADLLLVAFHGFYLQDDSQDPSPDLNKTQPPSPDQILAVWKAMEELKRENLVAELGVSEFSKQMLIDLLDVAEIPPTANQINLADCCVIPRTLRDFAKSKNIKLFTHNDPSDLVPADKLQSTLQNSSHSTLNSDSPHQPKWASRHSIILKSRGIVAGRGYIVHTS